MLNEIRKTRKYKCYITAYLEGNNVDLMDVDSKIAITGVWG